MENTNMETNKPIAYAKNMELDENIILVDKDKANQIYNFTSDSGDEKIKEERRYIKKSGKPKTIVKQSTRSSVQKMKKYSTKNASLVIKNNEDDSSESSLPELVVEVVSRNKKDNDDFASPENIKAWRKMVNDLFKYNNTENKTQNLTSNISEINKTCDTINKTSVIDVDQQDIIKCHHTVNEKQKEATRCKTSKIKEPNIEAASEIIPLFASTPNLDKSMVTHGNEKKNKDDRKRRKGIRRLSKINEKLSSKKIGFNENNKMVQHETNETSKHDKTEESFIISSHQSAKRKHEINEKPSFLKKIGFNENNKMVQHETNETSKHDKTEESFIISSHQSAKRKHEINEKPSFLKKIGFNENNKMVQHETNETSKHDKTEESFIISKHQFAKRKHEGTRETKKRSKESLDNIINKSTHESLMLGINSDSKFAQLQDTNISNLNDYEKIRSLIKQSTEVGNNASSIEILDSSTAIDNEVHEIREFRANTPRNWLRQNSETKAERVSRRQTIEEMIENCLDKQKTLLAVYDAWSNKTTTKILSNVRKQIREAQQRDKNLMRDLEEKYKESQKQTQESVQRFICASLCEYCSHNRKLMLQQKKDLKALYRRISKKT